MFNFFSRSRAGIFEERRKKQEVWKSMRRIMDRHSAEKIPLEDNRGEERLPFSIPVLIKGFRADSDCTPGVGISRNISDDGLCVLCPFEIMTENVVCVVWEEKPLAFIGTLRRSAYAGGGYWEAGIEFQELTSVSDWGTLRLLANTLNPNSL